MITASLTDQDFKLIGGLIQDTWGIKMPSNKRGMLESRLSKRLRQLSLNSFEAYRDYLFSEEGARKELLQLIDVVSTNKTEFFREPGAFSYLTDRILPQWQKTDPGRTTSIKAWSAGCSTGEEPYTLSMVLRHYAETNADQAFDFRILATDISISVLEEAKRAVYHQSRIDPIPMEMRRKYIRLGKDRSLKQVRIAPEIRSKVGFHRLNLMDEFEVKEPLDMIFCRNVIIYFERSVQEALLQRLCRQLKTGGYLFMGHSETLSGMNLPIIPLAPMIYKKR